MFSYTYGPESLKTTFLSQGCTFEAAPGSEAGVQNTHSKDREQERSLQLPGFSSQLNW